MAPDEVTWSHLLVRSAMCCLSGFDASVGCEAFGDVSTTSSLHSAYCDLWAREWLGEPDFECPSGVWVCGGVVLVGPRLPGVGLWSRTGWEPVHSEVASSPVVTVGWAWASE